MADITSMSALPAELQRWVLKMVADAQGPLSQLLGISEGAPLPLQSPEDMEAYLRGQAQAEAARDLQRRYYQSEFQAPMLEVPPALREAQEQAKRLADEGVRPNLDVAPGALRGGDLYGAAQEALSKDTNRRQRYIEELNKIAMFETDAQRAQLARQGAAAAALGDLDSAAKIMEMVKLGALNETLPYDVLSQRSSAAVTNLANIIGAAQAGRRSTSFGADQPPFGQSLLKSIAVPAATSLLGAAGDWLGEGGLGKLVGGLGSLLGFGAEPGDTTYPTYTPGIYPKDPWAAESYQPQESAPQEPSQGDPWWLGDVY